MMLQFIAYVCLMIVASPLQANILELACLLNSAAWLPHIGTRVRETHTPNAGKILAWRVKIETHPPDLADKIKWQQTEHPGII